MICGLECFFFIPKLSRQSVFCSEELNTYITCKNELLVVHIFCKTLHLLLLRLGFCGFERCFLPVGVFFVFFFFFLFEKIAIFVTFKGDYTNRLQKAI